MNLRRQLLVASLLLLTLPWAGCQFIREMEGALRQGQEQSLQATSKAVATVLKDRPELLYPYPKRRYEADDSSTLYASAIEQSVIIDGYGDDWVELDGRQFQSSPKAKPLSIKFKAATRKGRLYLFLAIEDDDVVFHNPASSDESYGNDSSVSVDCSDPISPRRHCVLSTTCKCLSASPNGTIAFCRVSGL